MTLFAMTFYFDTEDAKQEGHVWTEASLNLEARRQNDDNFAFILGYSGWAVKEVEQGD